MSFLQAILLIIGGLSLAVFGCTGGLSSNSRGFELIALAGVIIAIWGAVKLFIVVGRALGRVVNRNEEPKV